jgi:hypothetical protein
MKCDICLSIFGCYNNPKRVKYCGGANCDGNCLASGKVTSGVCPGCHAIVKSVIGANLGTIVEMRADFELQAATRRA